MALDRQPLNPDDDNPKKGSGYETVCECGAGFHSDKWNLRETVDTDDGEVEVSTVSLLIPHGLNHDDWFETCLFGVGGSRVVRRYETQEEAEDGHEEVIEQLDAGAYTVETTTTGISLEDG
jgi:hypothetical protein